MHWDRGRRAKRCARKKKKAIPCNARTSYNPRRKASAMHRLHKSNFTPMPTHTHTPTPNPRRHRMAVKSKSEARGYVFKESDLQWRAFQQSPRSLHRCTGSWTLLDLQSQTDAGDRLARGLSIDAGGAIQWLTKEAGCEGPGSGEGKRGPTQGTCNRWQRVTRGCASTTSG